MKSQWVFQPNLIAHQCLLVQIGDTGPNPERNSNDRDKNAIQHESLIVQPSHLFLFHSLFINNHEFAGIRHRIWRKLVSQFAWPNLGIPHVTTIEKRLVSAEIDRRREAYNYSTAVLALGRHHHFLHEAASSLAHEIQQSKYTFRGMAILPETTHY